MSGHYPLCQLRVGTIEYVFFDARAPAPSDGRLLSSSELRRLFSTHGSTPGLRALLRSLASAQAQHLRDHDWVRLGQPSDRALRQVCGYQIDHAAPALSAVVLDGPQPREPVGPFQPNPMFDEQRAWIEVWLIGENDEPIAGELCKIELPNGQIITRMTNPDGLVRVDDIAPPGSCKVCFPKLDEEAWAPA